MKALDSIWEISDWSWSFRSLCSWWAWPRCGSSPPDSRLGLTSLLAAAPYFGLASTRICTFTSSSTHSTDLAVGTGI